MYELWTNWYSWFHSGMKMHVQRNKYRAGFDGFGQLSLIFQLLKKVEWNIKLFVSVFAAYRLDILTRIRKTVFYLNPADAILRYAHAYCCYIVIKTTAPAYSSVSKSAVNDSAGQERLKKHWLFFNMYKIWSAIYFHI